MSKDFPNGAFSLSACPTSLELSRYAAAKGIETETEIAKVSEKWGKNHLAVHAPSFLELLQIQLLSPLAMFQVFCALLWLLDEYWSYTAWSLVSVVIFETTTVFQRTRTQKMLGKYDVLALFFPLLLFRLRFHSPPLTSSPVSPSFPLFPCSPLLPFPLLLFPLSSSPGTFPLLPSPHP
jgi:hypothetical protein